MNIDATTTVGDDADGVAQIERIQHGKFDAIIGSQTHDDELGNAMFQQPCIQCGCLTTTIIKKRTITVDQRVFALSERLRYRALVQQRMQGSPFAVLHTMIGPERLREAIQLPLTVRRDLVLAGKTTMISRMPVQTGDDGVTA